MTYARTTALLLAINLVLHSAGAWAAPKQKSTASTEQHSVMKIATGPMQASFPRVWLSSGHAKQCKVGVGEAFPEMKLPLLNGSSTDLASLRGAQATVILFWHPDRWMARTALADIQRDIVKKFAPEAVSVIGIAVHQPASTVQEPLDQAKATFAQLLDPNGEALAKVGTFTLPRVYVLDPEGTIVWFDLEYSESTRRELQQTLAVLTTKQKTASPTSK